MGRALHSGLWGCSHTLAEDAGGQQDVQEWWELLDRQPKPDFPVQSLMLTHVGHRLVLKTLYNCRVPTHVRALGGGVGRHDIFEHRTLPTTSSKGLGEQAPCPNTARHSLAAWMDTENCLAPGPGVTAELELSLDPAML